MAYPRFRQSRAHKVIKRSAGDIALANATVWTDVPSIGDIVLPKAQVGDEIEAWIGWEQNHVTSALRYDIATIVSAAPVTYFGCDGLNTSYGFGGWSRSPGTTFLSGPVSLVLAAGDISGGLVTIRLRYRFDGAGTGTINGTAARKAFFGAKNLGPTA